MMPSYQKRCPFLFLFTRSRSQDLMMMLKDLLGCTLMSIGLKKFLTIVCISQLIGFHAKNEFVGREKCL